MYGDADGFRRAVTVRCIERTSTTFFTLKKLRVVTLKSTDVLYVILCEKYSMESQLPSAAAECGQRVLPHPREVIGNGNPLRDVRLL